MRRDVRRVKNALQAYGGQNTGREGEQKGDHARCSEHFHARNIAVRVSMQKGMGSESECQGEEKEQKKGPDSGVATDAAQGEGCEEEYGDSEIFRVELKGIAAPVVSLSPVRIVKVREFRDNQRCDFLGVQRPRLRVFEAFALAVT